MAPAHGDEEEIDPAEQFDLDFAVMAGELAKLLAELIRELHGRQVPGRAAAA